MAAIKKKVLWNLSLRGWRAALKRRLERLIANRSEKASEKFDQRLVFNEISWWRKDWRICIFYKVLDSLCSPILLSQVRSVSFCMMLMILCSSYSFPDLPNWKIYHNITKRSVGWWYFFRVFVCVCVSTCFVAETSTGVSNFLSVDQFYKCNSDTTV